MKEKFFRLAKRTATSFLNNCFYIFGFLCCFLPPIILILDGGFKQKPEGWAFDVGFIIPLVVYLVIFFRFIRNKMHEKLGKWEAVNEIDENKHVVGILTFTLIEYVSYLLTIVLGYFAVKLLIQLETNLLNFFMFWMWWFMVGIILMYIDKIRHILKKGLLENEENEIIGEMEEPRQKR